MKRWLVCLCICGLATLSAKSLDQNRGHWEQAGETAERGRVFDEEHSAADKKQIAFIIKTLADKPMPKLPFYKGSLEQAGARVDHVHPLRFMMIVFTDEQLKAAMRNLKKRDWVYDSFMDDMGKSLEVERKRGAITDEHLKFFAEAVRVDVELIRPSAQGGHWKEFVSLLITHVPRKGDHGRYDT